MRYDDLLIKAKTQNAVTVFTLHRARRGYETRISHEDLHFAELLGMLRDMKNLTKRLPALYIRWNDDPRTSRARGIEKEV